MKEQKTEKANRTQTMRFCLFVSSGIAPRKGRCGVPDELVEAIPLNEIKYNVQRDEKTGYDYTDERTLKLVGRNNEMDINAEIQHTEASLDQPTLYPSPYVVLGLHGYTKHYYAGAERICAKIGGGFGAHFSEERPDLQETANKLFEQSREDILHRELPQNDLNCIASYGDVPDEDLKVPLYGVPYYFHTEAVTKLKRIHKAVERCEQETEEEDKVFFYHSDHLGSASWITNRDGDAIQHLQYLPYGEPFVDQRMSGYNERFTFTGKERDEETGYGYFGARYMDHELMTMWLSVDPMADKYPNISPYAYCAWNPVKLVDLDGMDTTIIFNLDNGLIYRQEDKNRKGLYFVQVEHGEYTTIYSGNTSYDKVNVGNNRTIISFKDAKQALAIYNHLKECKVQFEWNLMYLKNGSADLVTSASPDKIKMDPDDYSSENVQRWRHYHPSLPGYLYWMPSKEDQQFAQSLGLCSSILDFCNQEYDFAPIIKENNLIDAKQYRRYERILKNKYPTIRTTCE